MYILHENSDAQQSQEHFSYIGGRPMLPAGMSVPKYERTGKEMTFFFQFCLPFGHRWQDKIVSVFCTTNYASEDTLLPPLPDPLKDAHLTSDFFSNYQTFFSFFVFEKTDVELVHSYEEVISYRKLYTAENVKKSEIIFGEINPEPKWVLENESPIDFDSEKELVFFLFQTKIDYEFVKLDKAPLQRVIDYSSLDAAHADSYAETYALFVANELYFFGVETSDKKEIYVVPQS